MKVVLAFDKFKGSATSLELNEAAQESLCGLDDVTTACVPVADGGDGTTAVLASTMPGQWLSVPSMGPLLELDPVVAQYYMGDGGCALIEVAAASGLSLVPTHRLDVMRATTLGTGLLMRDAMERGCRDIVLGLGGSATCDAAMGIMCALGAEFLDADGHHLYPSGASLGQIARIETTGIPQTVKECRFTLLTDVSSPLCGERGTARVFAPQKGATAEQVELLERGMAHVAAIVGDGIALQPGCGAAGGIPSLMMHLLDCRLVAGAPYVLERSGLVEALTDADLVITGEGCLDRQTMMGKGPGCVIGLAREHGVAVAAVCGTIESEFDTAAAGLEAAVAVSKGLPLEQAMDHDITLEGVSRAVRQLVTQRLTALS